MMFCLHSPLTYNWSLNSIKTIISTTKNKQNCDGELTQTSHKHSNEMKCTNFRALDHIVFSNARSSSLVYVTWSHTSLCCCHRYVLLMFEHICKVFKHKQGCGTSPKNLASYYHICNVMIWAAIYLCCRIFTETEMRKSTNTKSKNAESFVQDITEDKKGSLPRVKIAAVYTMKHHQLQVALDFLW